MYILQLSMSIIISIVAHDFHVSVTNAEYKEERKELQISMKVFIDDLEDALTELHNEHFTLEDAGLNTQNDSLVFSYVREKFQLISDGNLLELDYVGHETELDICFIYMEIAGFNVENELSVGNSLFFDRFEDQSNIVNIRYRGEIYSVFLDRQHPVKKVRLD